jgi:hypothetical protein
MISQAYFLKLKKYCVLLIFLLGCIAASAQVISGRVLADSNSRPVVATITTALHQTSSTANGEFRIVTSGPTDTIMVYAIGYKTYHYPVSQWKQGEIIIRLKPLSLMLKDVEIRAQRDHKRDSIRNRKEFGQVFNYQPPKMTDMLTSSPYASNVPFAFVNIDLGVLVGILTKKSDPTYKLKKELLRDEQADYISIRYNRALVTRVAQLKGDSLDKFMDKYYPTIDWVKKTSDYDIIQYIKAKLTEFRTVH